MMRALMIRTENVQTVKFRSYLVMYTLHRTNVRNKTDRVLSVSGIYPEITYIRHYNEHLLPAKASKSVPLNNYVQTPKSNL